MTANTMQIILTAPDISCGHCVATVQTAVGALDGVERVRADAETKQVEVAFDPARVTRPRIESALDQAGYPAAPQPPALGRRAGDPIGLPLLGFHMMIR